MPVPLNPEQLDAALKALADWQQYPGKLAVARALEISVPKLNLWLEQYPGLRQTWEKYEPARFALRVTSRHKSKPIRYGKNKRRVLPEAKRVQLVARLAKLRQGEKV